MNGTQSYVYGNYQARPFHFPTPAPHKQLHTQEENYNAAYAGGSGRDEGTISSFQRGSDSGSIFNKNGHLKSSSSYQNISGLEGTMSLASLKLHVESQDMPKAQSGTKIDTLPKQLNFQMSHENSFEPAKQSYTHNLYDNSNSIQALLNSQRRGIHQRKSSYHQEFSKITPGDATKFSQMAVPPAGIKSKSMAMNSPISNKPNHGSVEPVQSEHYLQSTVQSGRAGAMELANNSYAHNTPGRLSDQLDNRKFRESKGRAGKTTSKLTGQQQLSNLDALQKNNSDYYQVKATNKNALSANHHRFSAQEIEKSRATYLPSYTNVQRKLFNQTNSTTNDSAEPPVGNTKQQLRKAQIKLNFNRSKNSKHEIVLQPLKISNLPTATEYKPTVGVLKIGEGKPNRMANSKKSESFDMAALNNKRRRHWHGHPASETTSSHQQPRSEHHSQSVFNNRVRLEQLNPPAPAKGERDTLMSQPQPLTQSQVHVGDIKNQKSMDMETFIHSIPQKHNSASSEQMDMKRPILKMRQASNPGGILIRDTNPTQGSLKGSDLVAHDETPYTKFESTFDNVQSVGAGNWPNLSINFGRIAAEATADLANATKVEGDKKERNLQTRDLQPAQPLASSVSDSQCRLFSQQNMSTSYFDYMHLDGKRKSEVRNKEAQILNSMQRRKNIAAIQSRVNIKPKLSKDERSAPAEPMSAQPPKNSSQWVSRADNQKFDMGLSFEKLNKLTPQQDLAHLSNSIDQVTASPNMPPPKAASLMKGLSSNNVLNKFNRDVQLELAKGHQRNPSDNLSNMDQNLEVLEKEMNQSAISQERGFDMLKDFTRKNNQIRQPQSTSLARRVNKKIIKPNNVNSRHFPQDFFNQQQLKQKSNYDDVAAKETRGTSSEMHIRSSYMVGQAKGSNKESDSLYNELKSSYPQNDYTHKTQQTIENDGPTQKGLFSQHAEDGFKGLTQSFHKQDSQGDNLERKSIETFSDIVSKQNMLNLNQSIKKESTPDGDTPLLDHHSIDDHLQLSEANDSLRFKDNSRHIRTLLKPEPSVSKPKLQVMSHPRDKLSIQFVSQNNQEGRSLDSTLTDVRLDSALGSTHNRKTRQEYSQPATLLNLEGLDKTHTAHPSQENSALFQNDTFREHTVQQKPKQEPLLPENPLVSRQDSAADAKKENSAATVYKLQEGPPMSKFLVQKQKNLVSNNISIKVQSKVHNKVPLMPLRAIPKREKDVPLTKDPFQFQKPEYTDHHQPVVQPDRQKSRQGTRQRNMRANAKRVAEGFEPSFSPSNLQAEKAEFGPPLVGDFKENPVFVDNSEPHLQFTTETQEQNSTNNKSPPTFKKKKKKAKGEEQPSIAQQYIVTATFGGEQKFLPANEGSVDGAIQIQKQGED